MIAYQRAIHTVSMNNPFKMDVKESATETYNSNDNEKQNKEKKKEKQVIKKLKKDGKVQSIQNFPGFIN